MKASRGKIDINTHKYIKINTYILKPQLFLSPGFHLDFSLLSVLLRASKQSSVINPKNSVIIKQGARKFHYFVHLLLPKMTDER